MPSRWGLGFNMNIREDTNIQCIAVHDVSSTLCIAEFDS